MTFVTSVHLLMSVHDFCGLPLFIQWWIGMEIRGLRCFVSSVYSNALCILNVFTMYYFILNKSIKINQSISVVCPWLLWPCPLSRHIDNTLHDFNDKTAIPWRDIKLFFSNYRVSALVMLPSLQQMNLSSIVPRQTTLKHLAMQLISHAGAL